MFCEKCGAKLPDGAMFCPSCGAKILAEAETKSVKVEVKSEENTVETESSNLNSAEKLNASSNSSQTSTGGSKGFEIAGMVLGISSILFLSFVLAIPGLILSNIAKNKNPKSEWQRQARLHQLSAWLSVCLQ